VALRVLGVLATSASVERAFSVARSVTGEYQMATRQETVSTRVMIQANCRIAQPLLEERKLMEDKPRRLGITEEIGTAHMIEWDRALGSAGTCPQAIRTGPLDKPYSLSSCRLKVLEKGLSGTVKPFEAGCSRKLCY
jgi:hypothetical protein